MGINLTREVYVFLSYVLCGVLCGMVFDIFRALRRTVRMNVAQVFITDVFFWVIITGLCVFCVFGINGGLLRSFVICGFILGCFLYFLTLGKLFLNLFSKIMTIIVNFIKIFFKILLTPLTFSYKIILVYSKKINGSICHDFIRKNKKDKTQQKIPESR